ncbi:hypothetical protein [Paenibacillus polymyxa]|uniref:hypothetical protein n=1 Tax=Paenibacillus polymyxa TaxID=1406 RepID=UPI002AB56944|nr:hypothetical protein [Paenibacillus polymyxa]MDY8023407.1 hypothetical protein [Paenibacillus polymyxa]
MKKFWEECREEFKRVAGEFKKLTMKEWLLIVAMLLFCIVVIWFADYTDYVLPIKPGLHKD